jgi:Pentapeptide repeats (8 copies)
MANPEHLELLKQGVDGWNAWREKEPSVTPNLSEADLRYADLSGANLLGANLSGARLERADLYGANLSRADLRYANLSGANLSRALLYEADLSWAELNDADLTKANLTGVKLVETNLVRADLTGCRIYGVSAWDVELEGVKQNNLVITRSDQPEVIVDNIEVAQFVYLLLHNEKIRDVIDTITSKVVLILGRFTPERKAVLDAIRDELRRRAYVPILFDFDVPATRDITETVSLLARMARFIVADLTDPSSIPKELEAIVPHLAVPVQPLLEGERPYAMFQDYWKYDWVLPIQRYENVTSLIGTGATKFIEAAESKMNELADKRRRFEAELIRPR